MSAKQHIKEDKVVFWKLPVFIALLIVLLYGCGPLPRVELDSSSASEIKKIGILEIKQPMNMNVENLGGAEQPLV